MPSRDTACVPPPAADTLTHLRRERDLYAKSLGEMTVRYEQKIRELSLLRRISDALRDCINLDEVFRRVLGIVLEELPTAACSLYLADESGELVLRARCSTGGPVEILRPGRSAPGGPVRIPPGVGPLGETFTSGEVRMDPAVPEGTLGWFPADARVLLAAPLGPQAGCLGVLALHERHIEDVPEDEDRLLPILATQASIAIENAVLYQRLKQHSDTLEVRVRERTAALEHLNAELQAAARQRSQFFSHFSHELRTPLNSILGFSELLKSQMHGPLAETQQRHVAHIHTSGQRLLRLINDILDLAKVEAGKLSLHMKPLALHSAVEEALAVMHPQATAKHLRLDRAILPDLPRVMADPGRFHQILLNLLSNAVKFTPEWGLITVTAKHVTGPGRRGAEAQGSRGADEPSPLPLSPSAPPQFIEIGVTDTGIGISPEDQRRLFRDFEQAAGADAWQQGTGLGLSLTRRLVSLHGGAMGLTSTPGEGSTFWFTLPAAGPVRCGEQQEAGHGT